MVEVALTLVAVTTAVGLGLSLRRRRFARHPHLSSTLDPMPAGVKHLAARVSELSDLGLHLPAASHALVHKRRLGVLLGLR